MKLPKILLLAVGLLVLLCGAAYLVAGILIPAERSFKNSVEIEASPEAVWNVITDKGKYMEWRPNLDRVEVINERDHMGGSYWIEYPKDSPQLRKFTELTDERPMRMEFDYSMGQDFLGNWKGSIRPTDSGVVLTTVDSYKTNGWLAKITVYIFFDMDRFAKDWNVRLKQRVESLDH